jgi:flagellar basal-body rod modification protein FlgD
MTVFGPQTATSTAAQATSTTASTSNGQLNMDAFLKMFTTQLQYQDPSNPMESYELAAQLAQFSTLAEITKVNTNLQIEQAMLTSINNSQMVDLLGKQVTGVSDSIQLVDGETSKAQFSIEQASQNVTVNIYDENDNLVRAMSLGEVAAGQYDVAWDGKDNEGNTVPNGNYRFEVEALDSSGNSMEVTHTVQGTVFAFRIENGTPYLILDKSNGLKVPISVISDVQQVV